MKEIKVLGRFTDPQSHIDFDGDILPLTHDIIEIDGCVKPTGFKILPLMGRTFVTFFNKGNELFSTEVKEKIELNVDKDGIEVFLGNNKQFSLVDLEQSIWKLTKSKKFGTVKNVNIIDVYNKSDYVRIESIEKETMLGLTSKGLYLNINTDGTIEHVPRKSKA